MEAKIVAALSFTIVGVLSGCASVDATDAESQSANLGSGHHEPPILVPPSCGLDGTSLERETACATRACVADGETIDCAEVHEFEWTLLTREVTPVPETESFVQRFVWRDDKTKIVWGEQLHASSPLDQAKAKSACAGSGGSLGPSGAIFPGAFELPSADDYLEADRHGLRAVIPQLGGRLWFTRSSSAEQKPLVFENGQVRPLLGALQSDAYLARCIRRPLVSD